jgi:hypothetical protein
MRIVYADDKKKSRDGSGRLRANSYERPEITWEDQGEKKMMDLLIRSVG